MNGRDLLYAIAGADPAYIRESERFAEIGADFKADRRGTRRRLAAAVIAAAVCAAVFGIVRLAPRGFRLPAPPEISTVETPGGTEPSDTERAALTSVSETAAPEETSVPAQTSTAEEAPTSAAERSTQPQPTEKPTGREPDTEAPATEPPTSEQPATEQPTQPPPATDPPTEPPTEPPTDAPSAAGEPGTPGAVFTSVSVSYAEAKETFAHPIVPCASSGFTGYRVGIVSKNGDIHADGAFCLSVTYAFTNGTVGLDDQDRWHSSSYSTWGDAYEYRGRTFYVQTPDVSRDYVYIGYWPTLDRGIGYQAQFDADADVYEIMDLIISLEI